MIFRVFLSFNLFQTYNYTVIRQKVGNFKVLESAIYRFKLCIIKIKVGNCVFSAIQKVGDQHIKRREFTNDQYKNNPLSNICKSDKINVIDIFNVLRGKCVGDKYT